MSTTTKKESPAKVAGGLDPAASELAKDVKNLETALSSLSFTQLADLLKEKKASEIEAVTHKLKEARGLVEALEQQLVNLGVGASAPVTAPARRGRKPGSQNGAGKPAKAPKQAKAKRGSVGEDILKFLTTKGKEGAHVKDIAAAIGNKPANVTAYFYAGAGKKHAKKVAPGTFALKK